MLRLSVPAHDSATVTTFVNFDVHSWGGRWRNARQLSVQAFLCAHNTFSSSDILSYRSWNGMTDHVRLLVHRVDLENRNLGSDFEIRTFAFEGYTIGRAEVFKRGPSVTGSGIIPIVDVYYDRSDYVLARMWIHPILTGDLLTYTIIHEFGHGLGLAHPRSRNRAVMHQADHPDFSYWVEPHDRHNLLRKYFLG